MDDFYDLVDPTPDGAPEADDEGGAEGAEGAEADGAAPDDEEYTADDELGAGDPDGPLVYYDGGDELYGVPTRADIVAEQASPLTEAIRLKLEEGKPVFFMPTDVEEVSVYEGGYPVYAIRLFGALADGSKAEVTVTDVDVFFDVDVAPGTAEADRLREVMAEAAAPADRVGFEQARPSKGYCPQPKPYARVRHASTKQRRLALAAAQAAGFATVSDDKTSYYRKAAREGGLPLCDWARLAAYEYTAGPTERSPLCAHVFRVPVASYEAFADPLAPKEKRAEAAATRAKNPHLAKDRTLELGFDIETHSSRGLGDLPRPKHAEDQAFMICASAHWKGDPTPLKRVCIVDVETAPDARWTTIVCGTPRNVLKAFALVFRGFAPDLVYGFNDTDYDWPFVVEKAEKEGLIGWMVHAMSASPRNTTTDASAMDWNYRDSRVKIDAGTTAVGKYLKVPGCVPIDVRTCFMKLYPKSDTRKATSLKWYLEECGLPSKADMPIKRLWRNYEAALAARAAAAAAKTPEERDAAAAAVKAAAEGMRHAAHYCVIDAVRPVQLMCRRNVVNEIRGVGTLAYLSLADCHFYAVGLKVSNLLGAYAWRAGKLMSMKPPAETQGGKYPGAYVFPPEKGQVPNPGRLNAVDAAIAQLRLAEASGDAAHLREASEAVEAALAAFASDRPVTGLDFSSLYPSLIMAYNLSSDTIITDPEEAARLRAEGLDLHPILFTYSGKPVEAWSIRHGNVPGAIGLYPSVLIDLFNKRAEMKGELKQLTDAKELFELIYGRASQLAQAAGGAKVAANRLRSLIEDNAFDAAVVAAAVRAVLAEAEAVVAATGAALTPGAPPPRLSPGSTLAEELADLKRRNKVAQAQVNDVRRLYDLARARAPTPAIPADALPELAPADIATASRDAVRADLERAEAILARDVRWQQQELEERRAGREPPAEALKEALHAEHGSVSFRHTCMDASQKAVKLFMNSFYGVAGQKLSPLFLLELAGGVTSAGQYNIKAVAGFVQSKGYLIKYGDTDSLYLVPPAAYFKECDADYVAGRATREDWYAAMVRITMRALNQVRDEVNTFLKANNGTSYLKMAYEEVLYPVLMTGKKKYLGIPHLNEVNFHPESLFIRGIDVVKQGQSGLLREIGDRIMWACCAVENRRTTWQIIEDVLRDAVKNPDQWNFDDFVRSDAWKPTKDNKPVQRFIARMKARHAIERAEAERARAEGRPVKPYLYEIPDPGERFSYVIVSTGDPFDLRGLKRHPKKGDLMEFARVAKLLKIAPDVAHYMSSTVAGLCARFVNYEPRFQPPAAKRLDDKGLDKHAQTEAKKAIDVLVRSFGGDSKELSRTRGTAYRRAYKAAAAAAQGELAERVGPGAAAVLHNPWIGYAALIAEAEGEASRVEALWAAADEVARDTVAADEAEWNAALGEALGFTASGRDSPGAGVAPMAGAAPAAPPRPAGVKPWAAGAKARPAAASPSAAAALYASSSKAPTRRKQDAASRVAEVTAGCLNRQEAATRAALADCLPAAEEVAARYEADLARVVRQYRLGEHDRNPDLGVTVDAAGEALALEPAAGAPLLSAITAEDSRALLELQRVWFEAVGVQLSRRRDASFDRHVAKLKARRLGVPASPTPVDRAERARHAADAARSLPPLGIVCEL